MVPPHHFTDPAGLTPLVSGSRLENYPHLLVESGLITQLDGGEVSGWLVNRAPADFDPPEVTVKIAWGSAAESDDPEDGPVVTWALTSDARVTPEEAGELPTGAKTEQY